LSNDWDSRNADPRAFIPSKVRAQITAEVAEQSNRKLGGFAQDFLRAVLNNSTEDDLSRREKSERVILAVGGGKGHDSEWVREAYMVRLRTVWLDVSAVACENLIPKLKEQFESIPGSDPRLRPSVKCAELRSALANPDSVSLDVKSVEIWYMCRVVEIMSVRSVRVVLRQIGKCLAYSPSNRLVIVDALSDHNIGYTGLKTSKLFSLKFLILNLSIGASSDGTRREVEVCQERTFTFFDKKFSALAFKIRTS